jgi:hypothetical protein
MAAGSINRSADPTTSSKNDRSSRRCDPRATPRARAFSDESTERFIEVRLIRQTAFNRDLRKRQVRLQHQALCTLNSPAHHILVRRFIETFPKGPAEMVHALLSQPCQIRRTDYRIQVRLYVS